MDKYNSIIQKPKKYEFDNCNNVLIYNIIYKCFIPWNSMKMFVNILIIFMFYI